MKRLLHYALLSAALSSCATQEKATVVTALNSELPHISAKCRIYDLAGNLVRRMPAGANCEYSPDGSVVIKTSFDIVKYDRSMKQVWMTKGKYLHHTFTKSKITENFLYLDSEFKTTGSKTFRTDTMNILSADGTLLKTVSMQSLLQQFKNFNTTVAAPIKGDWYAETFPNSKEHFENSHVNSFYEVIDTKDGQNTLSGYIVNCWLQKKIIFLNKELTQITRLVDMGPRHTHDVKYINSEKLRFYQNCNPKVGDNTSYVVEYNMKSGTFSKVHAPGICAVACGSVQPISDGKLFISHSNCIQYHNSISTPVVELLDMKTGQSQVLKMTDVTEFPSAQLIDAREYLRNTPGF